LYKLFLTIRYLYSRRIAYFAMGAVTLCVAMVLIVMSVMGGWLDQVMLRAQSLLGDVIVDNQNYSGFPLYEEFIDEISDWPEIRKATPVLYSFGLIRFPETSQTGTVRVVGIRLEDAYEVNAFRSGLYYEQLYPGTTTLDEQQQPLLGRDVDGKPLEVRDGSWLLRPTLPQAYETALAKARTEHLAATGEPLLDTGSTESQLDALLAKYGADPIPGIFGFGPPEEFEPQMAGEQLPGIIVGRDMVARRESDGRYYRHESYPKGCKISLTLWATSVGGNIDPIPIKQHFRYADDSRTGIYDIDSQQVYVGFDLLQRILQMNAAERVDESGEVIGQVHPRCSQIQVGIADGIQGVALQALCDRLEKTYVALLEDDRFDLDFSEIRLIRQVKAMTWQQSQAHIIGPIQKEKGLVTILFGIISLVAVALILCILYMIVLQKTRDIGIVKSIGGSSLGVATIFVYYGAVVGLVGSLLGTGLGWIFIANINEIQDFLISLNPDWRVWDLQVYSFDRIPSVLKPWDAIMVVLIGIAASTVGSLAAAARAGTMHPVESLRYE
jgi:lipoprotein-releasing system permease protein